MSVSRLFKIKRAIETESVRCERRVAKLRAEAAELFKLKMQRKANRIKVEALQAALEASRDLTSVEYDDYPHRWVRFHATELVAGDFETELLADYLRDEWCIYLDAKNDAATAAEGPCLLIGDDGDVYDQDSGKVVVRRADYADADDREAARNKLIEEHMERTGYFPSVVRCGRYGYDCFVDTKAKERAA